MTELLINGVRREVDADPTTPLLYVLRDHLEMNGAKFGCGLGQCGACTVLIDDQPVFSCLAPLATLSGRQIRTVEGLGTVDQPGLLQQAFLAEQAAQCGYCIAGMMLRAQTLLEQPGDPSEADIRARMQPNLCRCGTHMRILRAVRRAVAENRAAASNRAGQAAGPVEIPAVAGGPRTLR